MNKVSLLFIFLNLIIITACTGHSEGFNSIEALYKESVEVIKSKDKSKIDDFILKIMPDHGTISYMNKNHCEYRGIPKYVNQFPKSLDSARKVLSNKLYNYSLRLDRNNKLKNLKFEGFERKLDPEELKECGCPEILFEEIFVKCSLNNDTLTYSFGEILKVDKKWKSFTDFKLY